jgi:hypothetical protein
MDGAAGTGAGAACKLTPQLEQKASPAGLVAPHDAQMTVAAGAAAAGAAAGTDAGALAGATLLNGSPHSSQKAEPSGLSCPKEHLTDIYVIPSFLLTSSGFVSVYLCY